MADSDHQPAHLVPAQVLHAGGSAVITGGIVRRWPAAASRRPQPTTSRPPVFGRRAWEADTKLMQTIEDVPQCVAGVHALPTAVGSQLVASRGRRAVCGLLRPRRQGRLVVVMDDHALTGDLTGSARDTEKTMRFAQTSGEGRMVGRTPLTHANAALQRIWEGKPRFLIVLMPGDDQ